MRTSPRRRTELDPAVPAALPPQPVSAASFRARRLAFGAGALVLVALVALALYAGGGDEKPRPKAALSAPPPKPAPVAVLLPAPPPGQPVANPDDSGGINLPIESKATEVKEEDYARPAKKEPKEIPEKEKLSKPKIVMKVNEDKPRPETSEIAKAEALLEKGDWKASLALYNKILAKDKNNKEALKGKVFLLEKRGSEEALDALDGLADRYPAVALIHAARARILTGQNDTLEALKAWERAVNLDPKNSDYRLGLAVLNDKMGNEAEALRLYRQLPRPLPSDAQRRMDYLASHLGGGR